MDIELLRISVTVLSLAAYLGVVLWAYTPARRARFERDALLPFSHPDAAREAGTVPCGSPKHSRDPR